MKTMYILVFILSFNTVTLAMKKYPHASPPMAIRQRSIITSQENHRGSDCGIAIKPTIQYLLMRKKIQLPYAQEENTFISKMLDELEHEPGVKVGQWYGSAEVLDDIIIDVAKFFGPIQEESDIFGDIPKEIEVKPIIVSLFEKGILQVWPCHSQKDLVLDVLGKLRCKPGISADEKWRGTKTQLIDLILEVGACYKK